MKLVLSVTLILTVIPAAAYGGSAAPYTKEVVEKIYAIQKSIASPKPDKAASQEERTKIWVDYNRNLFQQAGYDYDETINQVVDDMRFHRERIPKSNANDSVFGFIYVTLNMMMSDCKYYKIDCLKYFPPKTAESVKWLSENTSFSF